MNVEIYLTQFVSFKLKAKKKKEEEEENVYYDTILNENNFCSAILSYI